jgi:hypothetical protein
MRRGRVPAGILYYVRTDQVALMRSKVVAPNDASGSSTAAP